MRGGDLGVFLAHCRRRSRARLRDIRSAATPTARLASVT
jgi:hypothetical protein